jgi:myotubularin-related protein 1/2
MEVDNKACLAIRYACPTGLPLRIADARPRVNASAMALQGKGYESVSALGGASMASLVFLDVENIHEMRKSLGRLREGVVPTGGSSSSSSSSGESDRQSCQRRYGELVHQRHSDRR